MTLEQNLAEMEQARERYWTGHASTSPTKLRWRALTVRHSFHVLPGESVLELGAGSGAWTEHLTSVFRGENPITAAVFNPDLADAASARKLPNTRVLRVTHIANDLPTESFDYVIGNSILCHDQYPENLKALHRILKPGGQILFFEANYWNPQVFLKCSVPALGRRLGQAKCQVGLRKYTLLRWASHQGFTHVDVIPFDILHSATPRFLIRYVQALTFVVEHAPVLKELCGTLYIWARKPGSGNQRPSDGRLTPHGIFARSVSVVVPCHNEEMNVRPLVKAILRHYDPYIHEIILVNDNSTDHTSDCVRALAAEDPRVKLLDRTPPNGVGRALKDGYAFASGRFILTTDADFAQIVPEWRDLFDAVAEGHDGAIGSRFSHESLLINYPFMKILANRVFHLLVNLLLPIRVRDISNNLKLYRADILRSLNLEEAHFAANIETGLKPLLAGYSIKEVPASWINRTIEMGRSTFRILRVAPGYASALGRILWRSWLNRWTNRPSATDPSLGNPG